MFTVFSLSAVVTVVVIVGGQRKKKKGKKKYLCKYMFILRCSVYSLYSRHIVETRDENQTEKEMTIQINSLNKMLTWPQSFIYLSKICTCTEPKATTRNLWSSRDAVTELCLRHRSRCGVSVCVCVRSCVTLNETHVGPPAETIKVQHK